MKTYRQTAKAIRHAQERKVIAQRIRELRAKVIFSIKQMNEGSQLAAFFLVIHSQKLANMRQIAKSYGRNKYV